MRLRSKWCVCSLLVQREPLDSHLRSGCAVIANGERVELGVSSDRWTIFQPHCLLKQSFIHTRTHTHMYIFHHYAVFSYLVNCFNNCFYIFRFSLRKSSSECFSVSGYSNAFWNSNVRTTCIFCKNAWRLVFAQQRVTGCILQSLGGLILTSCTCAIYP